MGMNLDNPHVETGDKNGACEDWRLRGATAENTDRGRLYVRSTGTLLQLFKAFGAGAGDLVAQGAEAVDADVALAEQNSSGLSGTVYRTSGIVGDGVNSPFATLYVWLCSELDLREQADDLGGLLLKNETDFSVPLKQTMREFVTRFSAKFPPPPSVGAPLRWQPSAVEQGNKGEQEYNAQFFYSLNRKGQWEITGLQNPDDYREWAIQQTLAKLYYRKVRSADPADPWWTRYLVAQEQADRLWTLIKAWVDLDQDGFPDREPKIRSIRVRRG